MENFQSLISEILEVDSLDINDEFISFDSWDSLTILSIIAMVLDSYNVELTREDIEKSSTIKGLKELVSSRIESGID